MPETIKQTQLFRFDQMATQVKDKVEPEEADVDRYVGLEHIDPESLKIRRWGEPSDVESSKILFRSGDIIFGKRRAYQRKLAVADFDGICSAHAMVLRPKTDIVLEEFLPFFMQSDIFMDRAVKISVGGLSPTINWRDLAKEEFALPPLEEQRRIAEVLQAATRAKDSYLEALAGLKQVSEAFCADAAGSATKQYPSVRLEDVANVRYGLTVNQARRKAASQAPYLRVANVQRGSLDLSEVKEIGVLPGDEKFELNAGDVLIVEGHADSAEIGRACVWPEPAMGMMHQNHLIRARCSESLSHDYLCMLINSPHGMVYFQSRSKSSSGLNTINSSVVKDYRIPLPPREVQDHVVAELIGLSRARASISARHKEINGLLKRVLASAPEGLR
jgi:type I restriction enzyme, S subunit